MAEEKKSKRIEKKAQRKKKESIFYMGPTIKVGLLEKGSVFRGKVPENVMELVKDNPAAKALFIAKKDYINACKGMREKGSRIQALYKQALKGGK